MRAARSVFSGGRPRFSTNAFDSPADHRLVLAAGLAAFGEKGFFGRGVEAVVHHAGEVAEAGGEAGFRVPGIDEGTPLALADEGSGTL